MNGEPFLFALLNLGFVLLVSPLFISLIKKVKAWCQGRWGPPLLQTYYMLFKLLKKETVYSSNSSYIMRLTPYVSIAALLVASLSVPLLFFPSGLGGLGNIILFLYLLALAKFFMALGGLDSGSTFGGMGSSREMTVSAVFEPIIIIVFAALAFLLKTTDLHQMFREASTSSLPMLHPSIVLLSISLFIILIVETARVPIDNPETHLELTMIHEAMILEQSGRNLILMELAHAIKQTLLMAVLINLIAPGIAASATPTGILFAAVLFILEGALLAVIVGIFESSLAKLRFFSIPTLFMVAFFFSFLTVLFEVFL